MFTNFSIFEEMHKRSKMLRISLYLDEPIEI